jgi:serine/threonine-protein kinase
VDAPALGDQALAVARSPASQGKTESPELLQDRLRVYFGLLAAVFTALYVGGIVLISVYHPHGIDLWEAHVHPSKIVNALAIPLAGGLWLLLGERQLQLRTLRALDVAVPLGLAWAGGLTTSTLPGPVTLVTMMLAVFLLLTLRAALVPSPPRRTALLAAAAAVAVLGAVYRSGWGDAFLQQFVSPNLLVAGATTWCIVIGATTTITSRVIYGLEREVMDARRLGQYTLLEKLGEGGMGAVYLAKHAMLRRPTAVKLLLPDRAGNANLTRFEREVQLTSMLTHPNTIAVYDYGRTTDGVFYYAMEYVDGVSLEELVRSDGPQPIARVIHVLRQVAGALAEAHRVRLIHRDVKPANILLCERGGVFDTAKVVDFGLVKQIAGSMDATVTQVDTITGTPAYLAPEMITTPDAIDARADLYGLGGVAYFMLTGAPVFEGATVVEICGHHLHTPPPPPSLRRGEPIPERLERLVLGCLAKLPEDRPVDVEAELARLSIEHPWDAEQAAAWWSEWRQERQSAVERSFGERTTAAI